MLAAGLAATLNLCFGATFGTVVPLHGTVSDIALDESRGRLYAANFSAYRVEVINSASRALLSPISVPMPPSAVAISPDYRYLVIGQYQKPSPIELPTQPFIPASGGYTLINLENNDRVDVNLNGPVLAIAFGSDGQALILTSAPPQPRPLFR
jgi:DNA-binding beta-propeller fold protein YncE